MRPLLFFLGVTFVVTWTWDVSLAISGVLVTPGHAWPTNAPGQIGPLLGALAAVLLQGRGNTSEWLRSMVSVSGPAWLWALAFGVPLVAFGLGAWIDPVDTADLGRFSGLPVWPWPLTLLALVVLSGIFEEAGWRGWLLPHVLGRTRAEPTRPLRAATAVAVVWGLWHAPMFISVQTYRQGGLVFVPMFAFSLWCGSVLLTWMWLRSGGSTLLAALWHGGYDLLAGSAASSGAAGIAVNAVVISAAVLVCGWEIAAVRRGARSPFATDAQDRFRPPRSPADVAPVTVRPSNP